MLETPPPALPSHRQPPAAAPEPVPEPSKAASAAPRVVAVPLVLAATLSGLAWAQAAAASLPVQPPERTALNARVLAVRTALALQHPVPAVPRAQAEAEAETTAQAPPWANWSNWSNWPKWSKWSNWANA